MNAPKEYYPIGYDKNFDDNFKSKVELPDTTFHCGDQKHFPGLYADEDLGCMVSIVKPPGDSLIKAFLFAIITDLLFLNRTYYRLMHYTIFACSRKCLSRVLDLEPKHFSSVAIQSRKLFRVKL